MKERKEKKRVLYIIDSLSHGGAETLVITLLKNLLGDYELHLIVLGKPYTLLSAVPTGTITQLLNFRGYRDIPKCVFFIRHYIRKNGIDLVHSHLYWSNIVSRLATPKKVPVLNCIHNISSQASYEVNKFSLYLDRLTYGKRHFIIAVSHAVLDDFDKWIGLKGRHAVLYNIIGDEFFNALPKTYSDDKAIKLVAVGNLRKQKNYFYMLDAFRKMPSQVSLDIYGGGPLKDELQQRIDNEKLNIRLCGVKPGMHTILPSYDAYVMCSTHEGLSIALLEAMASGLPAFLSDIPVQRESAASAAVYFSLDDTRDFVDKLLATFRDRDKLHQMSVSSIERAGELANKDNYMKRLNDIYKTTA
jgi:glycosyltransferase involved in cell wall biosynthesis